MHGNSRPRKRGGGGFQQNQMGGGGVGNVHYNEDMPLAIHNRVLGDGRGRWAGPHTLGWAPERNGHFKCLRASSGTLALAPHSQGWGRGRKGSWGSSSCGSPVPHLPRTASPGPSARRSWHQGGEMGYPLSARPPLSGSGDRGQQVSHPCRVRAAVTFCCVECPGTSCWCTAGGSLFW